MKPSQRKAIHAKATRLANTTGKNQLDVMEKEIHPLTSDEKDSVIMHLTGRLDSARRTLKSAGYHRTE